MRPLYKAIIVIAVATGVVVPAGYYSFSIFQNNTSVTLPQLVPGNSTMVLRADYNNTPIYAYNSTNTTGLVAGVSMAGFSSQLSSAENTTNGTHLQIEPSLYSSYRGYSIYQISNVSLEGFIPSSLSTTSLPNNISLNTTSLGNNTTVYLADLTGVVSLGSIAAVHYSLDAYLDNTGFQTMADAHFNNSANVSVYFSSTLSPVRQAVSNIYYQHSTFNLEMNNKSNANLVAGGLTYINLRQPNFTISYGIDNQWVNGTITIGTGNYYLLEGFISSLPAGNYSQLLPGFKP